MYRCCTQFGFTQSLTTCKTTKKAYNELKQLKMGIALVEPLCFPVTPTHWTWFKALCLLLNPERGEIYKLIMQISQTTAHQNKFSTACCERGKPSAGICWFSDIKCIKSLPLPPHSTAIYWHANRFANNCRYSGPSNTCAPLRRETSLLRLWWPLGNMFLYVIVIVKWKIHSVVSFRPWINVAI